MAKLTNFRERVTLARQEAERNCPPAPRTHAPPPCRLTWVQGVMETGPRRRSTATYHAGRYVCISLQPEGHGWVAYCQVMVPKRRDGVVSREGAVFGPWPRRHEARRAVEQAARNAGVVDAGSILPYARRRGIGPRARAEVWMKMDRIKQKWRNRTPPDGFGGVLGFMPSVFGFAAGVWAVVSGGRTALTGPGPG